MPEARPLVEVDPSGAEAALTASERLRLLGGRSPSPLSRAHLQRQSRARPVLPARRSAQRVAHRPRASHSPVRRPRHRPRQPRWSARPTGVAASGLGRRSATRPASLQTPPARPPGLAGEPRARAFQSSGDRTRSSTTASVADRAIGSGLGERGPVVTRARVGCSFPHPLADGAPAVSPVSGTLREDERKIP